MKKTITNWEFIDAFKEVRPDNFSDEGLEALFDYLEAYEQDTGQEMELDVIAICCDFTEYSSIEEFQSDYGDEYENMDDIMDRTFVITFDNGFIIQQF